MQGQTNLKIRNAKLQRNLRYAPTNAEHRLWQHLRGRQLEACKFRRQHPFVDYILDFVCLERKLVVELDGGSMQARRITMHDEPLFLRKQDSSYCDSGIPTF